MKNKWKILLILMVIGYSLFALYPSYSFYTLTPEQTKELDPEKRDKYINSALKLGLDLQGGMHVVLEIDDTNLSADAKRDAIDRAIRVVRNRIDQFGVSEPVIQQQGDKRIIVQLPGLQDPERVRRLIGETAQLEFRLVRENDEIARILRDYDRVLQGVQVTGTIVDTTHVAGGDTTETAATTAASADTVSASPFDSLPGFEPTGDVNTPFESDPDRPFTSYLISVANGGVVVDKNEKEVVSRLLETEQAKRATPSNSEWLWASKAAPLQGGGEGYVLYLVDANSTVDGSMLVDAVTRPNPDDPSRLDVGFTLNREGAIRFARFTGENIGRRIAIVLDKTVNSAPNVLNKISGGEGRITGLDSDTEAGDLAIVLRAGALPTSLNIIEERTVGPSLGHDSIVLSTYAAIGGFIIVLLFMLIYYRASGLIACVALVLNLIIVVAALAKLHAALTLPGIAGLILTIGMAVDANVLIFERIREELAKAKTVRSAIEAGYDRAFTTILDANVTTLITAFVLWQFGTGPIKGFATTLSIGIIASMFTALLCTRVIFDLITGNRQLQKLSI